MSHLLNTRKMQVRLTTKLAEPKKSPIKKHHYQSFRFGRMLNLDDGLYDSSKPDYLDSHIPQAQYGTHDSKLL